MVGCFTTLAISFNMQGLIDFPNAILILLNIIKNMFYLFVNHGICFYKISHYILYGYNSIKHIIYYQSTPAAATQFCRIIANDDSIQRNCVQIVSFTHK